MSILKKIKSTFYHWVKRQHKSKLTQAVPMNLQKSQDLCFVIDLDHAEQRERATELKVKLEELGKKVAVYSITKDKKLSQYSDFKVFGPKDMSWHEAPSQQIIQELGKKTYDILFSLYDKNQPTLDFFVHVIPSHLKVGYYTKSNSKILDLMVHNENKDYNKAIDQLLLLLGQINK